MTTTRRPTIATAQLETSGNAPMLDAIDKAGDPLVQAMRRRMRAYAELPGLGDIKADRTIRRSHKHSVKHKACR